MPRWLLPVVFAAGAAVCAGAGLARPQTGAGPPASGGATTPVISLRRLPGASAELVADQRLAQRLDAALTDPGIRGTQACVDVQAGGVPVFARSAATPLLPASNLKLLTTYAALVRLGAASRFTTDVVAGKPPAGGVVNGALYLVGGGDPLLATADYRPSQTQWTEAAEPVTRLEDLADKVKAAGITRVTGGVIGDESRYDAERTVASWKASYLQSGEIGPVGALVVNGGFAVTRTRHVPVRDPAAAAAAALSVLLQQRGIEVAGAPGVGRAPAGTTTVAAVESVPLGDVVGETLRESDNLAAEMLVKELGYRFGGGGSWAAGLGVVRATLVAAGIPLAGWSVVDGSGLDRSDRVTCATLAGLMSLTDEDAAVVERSLPTAADCGTLVDRFKTQVAAGRIKAKTGSLSGVAALTGFVVPAPAPPHPPCPPGSTAVAGPGALRFAVVVNAVASDSSGAAVEDRIAGELTSYPESPVLDPFGPLP